MARPIWEGQISFGLIQVPVTLYPAESRTELQFHLLDDKDKSRIRFKRVSEASGEEVPQERIVRAYELETGEYVVLDEKDFENADVEATQTVEILAFVDKDDIDPIYFDKPYYLLPGKKGEKGYVLLRETLRRSSKIGVAKVVIKTRQHLAALMPRDKGMILNLLRYPHELRNIDELKLPEGGLAEFKIGDREIEMATTLVNMMTTPWEPQLYRDEYHDALLAWIERKAKEGALAQPSAPKRRTAPGVVVDFMELLKKSVEQKEILRKQALGDLEKNHGKVAKHKKTDIAR